jgi:hypothetical protein
MNLFIVEICLNDGSHRLTSGYGIRLFQKTLKLGLALPTNIVQVGRYLGIVGVSYVLDLVECFKRHIPSQAPQMDDTVNMHHSRLGSDVSQRGASYGH